MTLNFDRELDTQKILPTAISENVAFMPGEPFYADPSVACNQFRLNFSLATPTQIDEVLARLAALFLANCAN